MCNMKSPKLPFVSKLERVLTENKAATWREAAPIRLTTWPIHQQNVAFPCLKLCSGRSQVSGSGSNKNGVSKYEGGPNLSFHVWKDSRHENVAILGQRSAWGP